MGTTGQWLHTLSNSCKNGTDDQRNIGDHAIGSNTGISLKMKNNKIEYNDYNTGGKLCNK